MNNVRMGLFSWIALILINVFLWAPLVVIAMLGFSDANSLTFPPPSYSMRWLALLTTDSQWTGPIGTSLMIGAITVVLSLLLGVPLALGLAKGVLGKSRLVQGVVTAPLILPGISLAIGFYFVSARLGILDSMLPLVIAHTTVGIAYVVVTVVAAERSLDRSLEPVARTLGASFFGALRTITLPLVAVGILGGAVLAFLHSWDDVVNALMLGTARVRPFPARLWAEMQHVLYPVAATAAVLLSVVSIGVLALGAVAIWLFKKRMPAGQAANIILRTGNKA